VETSRGPESNPSQKATIGDILSAPGSSDAVVHGNEELGLPGFPRAPCLLADSGQMVGGTELACS
jgi:hypothetical protein